MVLYNGMASASAGAFFVFSNFVKKILCLMLQKYGVVRYQDKQTEINECS